MTSENKQNVVCVLDIHGNPLMPTKRYGKVRRLLKSGLARAVKGTVLFTIQLLYETKTSKRQQAGLGVDPGRTNIGLAVESEGKCLALVHCTTNNKDVTRHKKEQKQNRQTSRYGERRTKKRRAIANGTLAKIDEKAACYDELPTFGKGESIPNELYVYDKKLNKHMPSRYRSIHGCNKPIFYKGIKNSEARFHNRKRDEGWFTPTANHLLNTHMKLIYDLWKILPITHISIERNVFTFMALENPDIWKDPLAFQNGALKGFDDVNEAIDEFQNGICLLCGKPIEDHHHIIPRSKGGADTLENIAGLCKECHKKVHLNEDALNEKLIRRKEGRYKEYAALSVINQIMPKFITQMQNVFGRDNVHITYGHETKKYRLNHGIPKTHEHDAYCIAMGAYGDTNAPLPSKAFPKTIEALQFRRHDRAVIKCQRERTYYQIVINDKGKIKLVPVAKNRHRRFEQKKNVLSADEWYQQQIDLYDADEARKLLSQLTVKKSVRYYNDKKRIMPGALFKYKGEVHILSGSLSNGKYYRAYGDTKTNYPSDKCTIVCHNKGIVYMR